MTTSALLVCAAVCAFAQANRPQFDVASVKLSTGPGAISVRPMPGGRLTATAPVKLLAMYAYGLQRSQIVGGPDWVNSDRYEIDAKADESADRARLLLMLQTLIEERFQMKAHREMRETQAYVLTAA